MGCDYPKPYRHNDLPKNDIPDSIIRNENNAIFDIQNNNNREYIRQENFNENDHNDIFDSRNDNSFEFDRLNTNYSSNHSSSTGAVIAGKFIDLGGNLATAAIKLISSSINKSKDIEIEKLRIEQEKLIEKEKEKKELKKTLKLEFEKKENEFYEKQIVKFQYNENAFNIEEIKKIFDENLLKNKFDEIKRNNEFMKRIDNKILDSINECKSKLKKNERLNVYIMGCTGVGKTCLKNALCEKLYSKEGFGGRGTPERKRFECECHKYLSITDNIGFELGGIFSISNLIFDTEKFFMEKIKSNYEAIHCIWYCITGTRLQDEEYKVITNLRKIYKEKNIPIIIIYTQAIEPEKIEKMKQYINKKLEEENNELIGEKPENIQFIPLLSKQTTVMNIQIKPYNLSKLIINTYKAFEYSMDLINKKSLIELVKENIKNDYENKLQLCLERINNLNIITEDNFNEIIESLCKLLFDNDIIKIQSLEINFLKEIILSFINEKYLSFKEEKEKKFLNDIMNMQRDFCLNNSKEEINLGSFMKTDIELKNIINEKIDSKNRKEFIYFYFDKISKIFLDFFVKELSEKLLELFLNEIESENIKNEIYISSKIDNNIIIEGISKLIDELKRKES